MVLQSVSRDDSVGFCKKKNVNKQKPLLNRKLIKSFSYFSYDFWKKQANTWIFKIKLVLVLVLVLVISTSISTSISEIFWSLLPFQSWNPIKHI